MKEILKEIKRSSKYVSYYWLYSLLKDDNYNKANRKRDDVTFIALAIITISCMILGKYIGSLGIGIVIASVILISYLAIAYLRSEINYRYNYYKDEPINPDILNKLKEYPFLKELFDLKKDSEITNEYLLNLYNLLFDKKIK